MLSFPTSKLAEPCGIAILTSLGTLKRILSGVTRRRGENPALSGLTASLLVGGNSKDNPKLGSSYLGIMSMKRTVVERQEEVTLYTTEQAAKLLKLHPKTLVNWRTGISDVALPFVKIGRAVRYRHADLLKYIEGHTFENNAEARS